MDARAAGQTRREQLLKAMDTAGSCALLLALAALCTRAVLTGGHPGLMALAAGAVCLGMGWRRWASRRRLLDAQLAQALERHEAALIRCYRQGRRGQPHGAVDDRSWRRDLDRFLQSAVAPDAKRFDAWRESRTGRFYACWAEEFVSRQVAA